MTGNKRLWTIVLVARENNLVRLAAILFVSVFVHPALAAIDLPSPFSYVRTIQKAGVPTLGRSLADFHGDLLVGASGHSYLYDVQTGALKQEYAATGTSIVGNWIAGHGDKIAIGSPTGIGSVRVFNSSSGQLLQTLNGSETGDRFGYSLASNGTSLFMGAPELRNGSTYYGQGKVVVLNALGTMYTINNPQPGTRPTDEDSFGYDTEVVGNDLYVGALYDSNGGKVWRMAADSGATLFQYNNPHGTLGNSNRPQFGVSLDVLGDHLLVGANQSSASGTNASGAAYLFNRSSGALLHTLFDPVPGVLDNFGIDVALVDDFAVISSPHDDDGKSEGLLFVFDVSSGLLVQTIETPLSTSDSFGFVVQRVGDNWLAVTEATGQVHLYSLNSSIPEPSTAVLLLPVFAALILKRRYGKK